MSSSRNSSKTPSEITTKSKLVESKPELLLECPSELGPVARQEWDRLISELIASDLLKKVDRGPLVIYCGAYALWVEGTEALQKYGAVMKSPNGYPIQSPYVSIVNQQAAIMIRIACEFGFTPASRGRIPSPPKGDAMLLELEDLNLGLGRLHT